MIHNPLFSDTYGYKADLARRSSRYVPPPTFSCSSGLI